MILLTGGAGYIGSHINKVLHENGMDTVVLDNLSRGNEDMVKWGHFVHADLRDREALRGVFARYSIDAVIHLAAYAYVGESMAKPSEYYNNNLLSTLALLDAMMEAGCKKIIFSSSCATYGVPDSMPITEEMPQNPINPYGATKLMAERMMSDYAMAYGLRYVFLRYFNVAGSDPDGEIGECHDPETHIIPRLLDAALRGGSAEIYGDDYATADGTCVRDYIHVMDLADAHVLAYRYLQEDGASAGFNLGNARGYSNLEVAETVKRVTGRDLKIVRKTRRPGDPDILVGSSQKARECLHWVPCYEELETIVRHAWQWRQTKEAQ